MAREGGCICSGWKPCLSSGSRFLLFSRRDGGPGWHLLPKVTATLRAFSPTEKHRFCFYPQSSLWN